MGVAPAAHAATFTWTTGNFVPGVTAPSPLSAADVLNINAGGNKFFDAVAFTNGGTVNWNADTLFFQSGGAVINNALWNATSDNAFLYNGSSAPSFTNNGTFRKSGGVGSTTINSGVGFVNNGTIDAQTGSIAFVGGSTFNAGSVFTGAGSTVFSGINTFNGSFTSSNVVLSGGTHSGNAAALLGTANWTGGTLGGTWSVGGGQTVVANNGGNKFIETATVTNKGTLAWNTTDALYLQSAGALRNEGLFVANQTMTVVYNGGSAPAFENKAGATVRAAAGRTLTLNNTTGFVNNGGTLDALAGGAIVYASGSTFNAGTVFSGAGLNVAAGNNQFNGSLSSANLVLQSGTHAGTAAVVSGNVAWSGGLLSGAWTVLAGQTMHGEAGGNKFIDNVTLTNQGTFNWNTTDALYFESSGNLVNQGTFAANETATLAYNGGSSPSFTNTGSGTVRAAAGKTLTINFNVGFVNNGGTLNALAGGSIVYAGGSVFNTGTQFTGAGTNVATSNNTYNGALSAANLVLQSGIHTGGNAVLSGGAVYSGGTLTGNWRLAAGSTLTAATGANKFIDAGIFTNQGTIAWGTTDTLYLQSGAALMNQGTLNFGADTTVSYNGGAAPSFINTGLIVKSAGAGSTTIASAVGFDNQGTLDVQTGTIALPNNFANNGVMKGLGTYSVAGTLSNAGTVAPGASPGTLSLSGSYVQTAAGRFAVELQSLATHDLFNISGTAALNGTLAISCFAACSLAVGDVVTILDSVGDLSGSFASVTLAGFATGAFTVVYDTAADRVQLLVTQAVTAAVPEPETYLLMLAGLASVGWLARRRRS